MLYQLIALNIITMDVTYFISKGNYIIKFSSARIFFSECFVSSNNLLSSLPPHFLRSENSQIRKHFSNEAEQFWDGSVVKVSIF